MERGTAARTGKLRCPSQIGSGVVPGSPRTCRCHWPLVSDHDPLRVPHGRLRDVPPPKDPNSRTSQLRQLLEDDPNISHKEAAEKTGLKPESVRMFRTLWGKPLNPRTDRRVGASDQYYRCRYWPDCDVHPGWTRPKFLSLENKKEIVEMTLEGATIIELSWFFDADHRTISAILARKRIGRW